MKNTYYLFLYFTVLFLLSSTSIFAQVLFQPGQSLSTPGSWFEVVETGDVNNDGRTDIVAGTGFYFDEEFDYKLFVYLQSESGTFPTTEYYSYEQSYPGLQTIAIGDVNNDSLQDVIIGYAGNIAIFLQNASGTLDAWESYYAGSGVQALAVADINNDSLNDIVVCPSSETFIRVFYQTLTGFTTKVYAKPPSGRDDLEIGDVNADGLNDVVMMAGAFDGGIHVFIQNTSGTLNNYVSYFPGGPDFNLLNGIAIGDLNNDGHQDVVAAKGGNIPSASLAFWYQDTSTHLLKPAVQLPAYEIPSAIEVADFNCDGRPEIFVSHGGWNAVTVWTQDAEGMYAEYDRYSVSVAQHPSAQGITSGDINHDGKPDIVAVGDFTTIQLMYNISELISFTHIDTVVVHDTITHFLHADHYSTITQSDTIEHWIITQIDSFLVSVTYRQDSLFIDSIFFRNGFLCDSAYSDTITISGSSFLQTETRDSTFWSSSTDSTLVSAVTDPYSPEILIYPNPFSSQLMIECPGRDKTFIALYDITGRILLHEAVKHTTILNTVSLPSGVYMYKLSQGAELIKTGKVVKR